MTVENMIEEMAVVCENCKTSCDKCFDEYEKTIWQNEIKIEDRAKHCQAILHAQRLYSAGYRKIPENAVVLTKEEQDKILQATEKRIEQLKKERNDYKQRYESLDKKFNQLVASSCEALAKKGKETARAIFDTIIKELEEQKERVKSFYGVPESVGADTAIRTVKELAKECGVGVEE